MLFRICISLMISWWVLFIIGLLDEKNAFIENTKLSTCNISNVISIAIVDSAHCQDIAKKIFLIVHLRPVNGFNVIECQSKNLTK